MSFRTRTSVAVLCVLLVALLSTVLPMQIHHAHAASTPGGMWVDPTTDGITYEPGLTYTIKARAYGNGSPVSYVNFTIGVNGNWAILQSPSGQDCSPQRPDYGTTDTYSCTTDFRMSGVYVGGNVQLSFDVYAQDGGQNQAPNGERNEIVKISYFGGTWNSPNDGATYHVGDHIRFSANAYPQNGGYPIDHVAFTSNSGGNWHTVCTQGFPSGHEFGCDWYPGTSDVGSNVQISFDVYYTNNSYVSYAPNGEHTLHILSNNTHPQLSWASPPDHFAITKGNSLQLRANLASLADQFQISNVDFRAWWPGNPNNVSWDEICTVNNPNYGTMYGCNWDMSPVPAGILQVRFDVHYTDGYVQTYEGPTHEGNVSPGQQVIDDQPSGSWAGYVVQPSSYTYIKATWVVPAINCNGNTSAQMGIWVGMGGYYSSGNLKQAGTVGICTNGQPQYKGFWQMPAAKNSQNDNYAQPYEYDNQSVFPVQAGDTVTATVFWLNNGGMYLLQLDMTKNGQLYEEKHFTDYTDAPRSAEWIVEPESGGFLPNFGNVTLTNCSANNVDIGKFNVVHREQTYTISGNQLVLPIRDSIGGINGTQFTATWHSYQ